MIADIDHNNTLLSDGQFLIIKERKIFMKRVNSLWRRNNFHIGKINSPLKIHGIIEDEYLEKFADRTPVLKNRSTNIDGYRAVSNQLPLDNVKIFYFKNFSYYIIIQAITHNKEELC